MTPEDGVARYEHDRTQGPACAVAAGAATIYRNYFTPVGEQAGQTKKRQLDGLADIGAELNAALDRRVADLWTMRNGYALCKREGLDLIAEHLRAIGPEQTDALAGKLRIGVHRDVEVTDGPTTLGPIVSPKLSAAPCPSPTAKCRGSTGRRSRSWCSMRPTRRRCWRPCSTPDEARQTSSC